MPDSASPSLIRPRSWWRVRLSLRAMMVLVLVIALPLGWKVRRAATQRRAVATVVALGGQITYEDQIDPTGRPRLPHRPRGPAWLRSFLGDEFFQEVAWVHFVSRPQGRMVDDETIAVLKDFDHLQGLNLQGQPGMSREAPPDRFITVQGLARLGSLPRLRSLGMDFIGCDAAMISLLPRWPTLEHITIFDLARTIPGSSLAAFADLPRLQFVRINAIEAGGAGDFAQLAALPELKHLSLNRSPASDAGLDRLAATANLQIVELLGTELTAETLAVWGRRPALEVLRFDGSRLARGDLRALAGQSRLTHLSIVLDGQADGSSTHYPVHRTAPRFGDEDLDALRTVPLQQLAIMGLDATDAGVERLLQTHSFTSLTLSGRGVTDASLPRLARQAKLYALVLANTNITDAGLAQLATCAGLGTLSLVDNPRLTDAGLAALPAFPALKNLTIRQPALQAATLEALNRPRPGIGRLNVYQLPRGGAAITMAYSDFTIAKVEQRFGVTVRGTANLFATTANSDLPPHLSTSLERYVPLALNLNTEKAKSELVIAPILLELKLQYPDQLSLFSGLDFPIDPAAGLTGRCDFLLARSPQQLNLVAPVCVLVEAKNENIVAGIPQAVAEMIAARRFNEAAGTPIDPIYGVVTTGLLWRFLKLEGDAAHVDSVEYPIQMPTRIFGILTAMALGE